MDRLLRALRVALPGFTVQRVGERVQGYANDRWVVGTDAGDLLVKVTRLPNPPQAHIDTQRQVQDLLDRVEYPTPRMLHLEASETFGGRLMSVQQLVPAQAGDADTADDMAVLDTLGSERRNMFFVDFGRAVGQLHSLEPPSAVGWLDDHGIVRTSWPDVAFPEDALRLLRNDPAASLDQASLETVERRIVSALNQLGDVQPRLVHRDLHLGNTLHDADGRFAGLIDFDIVRVWDYPWDFAVRLDRVFDYWRCETPFLQGYYEQLGELPADFGFRRWLYTGIDAVRTASEYIAGNYGVNPPSRVITWLDIAPPS